MNNLAKEIHAVNVKNGFYDDEKNIGEMLALIHSEVSEALDGILNWTELAFLTLFESNEFAEYDKHGKGVITFYYKTLMDALRKVRDFEKRTFL